MKNWSGNFRLRYILFVAIIAGISLATQVVIHRYLQQEYADAGLINLAGRQRMLSQRITKLSLFIEKNQRIGRQQRYRYDSLSANLALWGISHQHLIGMTAGESKEIDSLMEIQGNLIKSTSIAAEQILALNAAADLEKSLLVIETNDIPFLMNMDRIVHLLQRRAEEKIERAEKVEYILAVLSVLVITAGFIVIVKPSVNRLTSANKELQLLNHDIRTQDEEIRANFEQISELQSFLEQRERQYRERVEDAPDIIYEMNPQGFYTYVNPSMVRITGYSQDELLRMNYAQLIAPEFKESVFRFYGEQVANLTEATYREFPVMIKSGAMVWVAQTVRIMFREGNIERIHAIARDITDLQKSRSDLQQSEKRFKSFAENSPVGIYELDENGVMIFSNRRFAEISGLSDQMGSEERYAMIHKEDRDRVREDWKKVFTARKNLTIEYRYAHPDKGTVWVISHAVPSFDDDWKFKGYIGTVSDTTERKKAYVKLAESEATYKLISTNSHELITLYKNDRDTTRTFISPSVKNILGYEPDELIGKSPFDIIHADDARKIRESALISAKQGQMNYSEYRIRRKDGVYIWMESSSHPFFDEQNVLVGFQSSAREITLRKRMEQVLAEREELYRLLSENSRDLIALHDPDNTYKFVSSSFLVILGYFPEEMLGRSPLDFIHPEDVKWIVKRAEEDPLKPDSKISFEYRFRKKDNTYIWAETYLQPIVGADGVIISIQSSSRDITLRKAAEVELTHARIRAEEANKAKSQFLSMMSHEIRTPMNAVIGLSQFMIDDNPQPHQLENLKLLHYSGENLLAIINDILDFSKIEAGKIDLEDVSFDIIEMLRNNVKMMELRSKEKGLNLTLSFSGNMPRYVMGDSMRLNQVLVNLIGNAIKFTEQGQISIDVRVTGFLDNVYRILFSVADTGIGIEREKTNMIFESFSQANLNTTRKFGGTGLGLAITKRLINLMGSDILVDSEFGKGSKFWFILTMKAGKQTSEITDHPEIQNDVTAARYSVLLVEDNPVNQMVAANYLKKWGLAVTIVSNGKEAVDIIASRSWDVVLMDLQMPEMDGYEATKMIRRMKDKWFREIPIIALTASALTDRATTMKETGLTDYVTKPFQPDELHNKVFYWLRKRAAAKPDGTEEALNMHAIDFNTPEDQKLLAKAMIGTLEELLQALGDTMEKRDPAPLSKALHKSKTTLAIINDKAFLEMSDGIETLLNHNPNPWEEMTSKREILTQTITRKTAQLARVVLA